MSVLDYGCGNGDVALILREIVGPEGAVLGIDSNSGALASAGERARASGYGNVTFREADIAACPADLGSFDVIIGRRVLMYLADPVATVASLARHLRPGGLFIAHEHDNTLGPVSHPPMPLHLLAQSWMRRTVEAEGVDMAIGFHLPGILAAAGLTCAGLTSEGILQTPEQPYELGSIIAAIADRIVERGIASYEEMGLDDLIERLDKERAEMNAVYWADTMFGVWARKT